MLSDKATILTDDDFKNTERENQFFELFPLVEELEL